MSAGNPGSQDGYPQGEALQSQITGRHRISTLWRVLLVVATSLAVVVLMVLLVTIINQSFGLAAVRNTIPPESLVIAYQEGRILGAENTTSSEDDNELVAGIGGDPDAVGFFGYAYYRANDDTLRALAVDGVSPSAETANSGEYPLTRPLYLYTSEDVLVANPQVARFVTYYLDHVNQEIGDIGYFPADDESLAASRQTMADLQDAGEVAAGQGPAAVSGDITIVGSSTVYPLTQRLANRFEEGDFTGDILVEAVGSTAGLQRLCVDGTADIANASRPITQLEIEACRANGHQPVEIRIGTDALAVVVSQDNNFADQVSQAELQRIFTNASTWSSVNEAWPEAPIKRFVPGADSGTLDFFSETVFDEELADLPKDALVEILAANISTGLGRRLERDQRFYDARFVFEDPQVYAEVCAREEAPEGCTLAARSQENVYQLVRERVVEPAVEESWFLFDSLLNRTEIIREAQQKYPGTVVNFYSWLNRDFIRSPQSSIPELAGVRTAILGTLWVIVITMAVAFPMGVGAAIYLEEYADRDKWFSKVIQTNINNLAGVPSIIYGMLGLAVFVRALEPITSGALFGVVDDATTANGRTILAAGLTLALLILPIIIISAQESIRAVPGSLRQASYGLGATRWQTIWHHVLPSALPGILTGAILSMARAIGETAPLVVIGASTFITADPTGPFSKFTVLPIQIYQWTSRPQGAFRNIAGAAIIVLLVLLLALSAAAVILRNRTTKKLA